MKSLLFTLALTFVLTMLLEGCTGKLVQPRRARPWLAVGLLLGLLIAAPTVNHVSATGLGEANHFFLALGGLVLLVAGMTSDFGRPTSRIPVAGTLLAGVLVFLGGLRITYLGLPGVGSFTLEGAASLLATMAWVFLVVSVVELCALLPLASGAVALVVGSAVILPVGAWRSGVGFVLCGALLGGVAGRLAGELLRARSRPPAKSETLVLGYFVATATLSTFLKSATAAALVLPLVLGAIMVVLLGLQSMDRSLLLRPSPRE